MDKQLVLYNIKNKQIVLSNKNKNQINNHSIKNKNNNNCKLNYASDSYLNFLKCLSRDKPNVKIHQSFPRFVVNENKLVPSPLLKVEGYKGDPHDLVVCVFCREGLVLPSQHQTTCFDDSFEYCFDNLHLIRNTNSDFFFSLKLVFVVFHKYGFELTRIESPEIQMHYHSDLLPVPTICRLKVTGENDIRVINAFGNFKRINQDVYKLNFNIYPTDFTCDEDSITLGRFKKESNYKITLSFKKPTKQFGSSFFVSSHYSMGECVSFLGAPFLYMEPNLEQDFISSGQNGNIQLVESSIKEIGSYPNSTDSNGLSGLHIAIEKGNFGLVKYLLNKFVFLYYQPDKYGLYPLHYAVQSNLLKMVQVFIDHLKAHKYNLNVKDYSGMTPLHWASSLNYVEIAKLLIDAGANVNIIDGNRETPLFKCQSIEMIRVLRYSNGINIGIRNTMNETCYQYLKKNKNFDSSSLLNIFDSYPDLSSIKQPLLTLPIYNRNNNNNQNHSPQKDTSFIINKIFHY